MLKVWCDFNSRTPDGLHPVLCYRDQPLKEQAEALGISNGTRVILYQDDDDFGVVATLDRRYIDYLGGEEWVATPDWSTLVRKADAGQAPR